MTCSMLHGIVNDRRDCYMLTRGIEERKAALRMVTIRRSRTRLLSLILCQHGTMAIPNHPRFNEEVKDGKGPTSGVEIEP